MSNRFLSLEEPQDYYLGVGSEALVSPTNVILFSRGSRTTLQQEALQNRSHHRLVLVCNLGSEGTVHVNHLSLSLRPGQALLIFPYQFHHFSHLSGAKLNWLFCTFESASFVELESLRNQVVNVGVGSQQVLDSLLGHWKEKQVELVQVVLQYLLLSLKRDCESSGPASPLEKEEGFINAINRRILAWRGSPLLVSELARQMGYSDSRLRALFREAAGIPLGAYIRNFGLNRAMSLLRGSELSIGEVAEASGFGSVQSFCRVFKKETGVTPRGYRKG